MKNIFEIFYRFFTLGFISFGGPIAHLGYFRKEFVEKLNWLDDTSYSKMVALSQFLPGPSSSQVGFTIGLKKGGLLGAITAFFAFTFPSFLLLYLLVTLGISSSENEIVAKIIIGLKLFAVVIVSDAIIGMYKSFCKDSKTIAIFIFATITLIIFDGVIAQMIILSLTGILGLLFIKNEKNTEETTLHKTKKLPLILFFILLFIVPFFSYLSLYIDVFSSFYQAGALVFGGGHVVLPLLENSVGDMVSNESFLIGYSLAQAVPGPMFTIASYLGADIFSNNPFLGAVVATLAIFLPGFLLILAFYESFESYSKKAKILSIITALNAAVVGLLASVLFTTVLPSGLVNIYDIVVIGVALYLMRRFKIPILLMITIFIGYGFLY